MFSQPINVVTYWLAPKTEYFDASRGFHQSLTKINMWNDHSLTNTSIYYQPPLSLQYLICAVVSVVDEADMNYVMLGPVNSLLLRCLQWVYEWKKGKTIMKAYFT
jgi:hypothetical protein